MRLFPDNPLGLLASILDLPHSPLPAKRRDRGRTLRLAWTMLLVSFGVFCMLFAFGIYLIWYYRVNATVDQQSTLIVRAPAEWVTWQRKGRTTFERVQDRQQLREGDRIRIASLAGYGQTATVRLFENSTLDLWAGADVVLEELRTSQWNHRRLIVTLNQQAGYIRYDLRDDQPYEDVTVRVRAGPTLVTLAPGGSYSIQLVPSQRRIFFTDSRPQPAPVQIDVAVRSGRAEVQSANRTASIVAGQRILVDPVGIPSLPLPARWELILDNHFSQYSEKAYNNTTIPDQPALIRSDTWQVFSVGLLDAPGGFFKLLNNCLPPETGDNCARQKRTHIAQFLRTGDQTKPFLTGVFQILGAESKGIDISEYRSLVFSVWLRVVHQSVPLAGEQGSECPVMIRFETKRSTPSDPEQERVICFYSSDDPALEPARAPGLKYYRVPLDRWKHFTIDLRRDTWLPEARYMRSIQIYANGHDYDARVTGVSLVGSHYSPYARPDKPAPQPTQEME